MPMSDFILEIYGEEIPSSAQHLAERELESAFKTLLKNKSIDYKKIQVFSTPRRLTVFIRNVAKLVNSEAIELRGPRTSSNKEAIQGFLRSNQIQNIKKLQKKMINDSEYFVFTKKNPPKKTSEIFSEEIPTILSSIKWKKSMRWGNNNDRWIRPINSILCVFDKCKIPFIFAGTNSDVYSFGNYHYSTKKNKCLDIKTYEKKLKKNFVILDRVERKKNILEKLKKFCKSKNLIIEVDEKLLTRVCDSIEFPNLFFGIFDKVFFKLPDFLLRTVITEKQDYFYFKHKNGEVSNNFGFVSNKGLSKKAFLSSGNENVLRARFSDALFFIKEDNKINLNDRTEKLSKIIFYDGVGNLLDRSNRIKFLTEKISEKTGKDISKIKDYLNLSNVDLTTEMVKEFPSLQGMVGGYYSQLAGINKELCLAISQQYKHSFDSREKNHLSFSLSISQKLDNIFGFFASRKKLSGAGDPYGIRRSVLSIINITIEKKLDIDFYPLLFECKNLYQQQKIKIDINFFDILQFLNKRIVIYLNELGYSKNVINANLLADSFNPYTIFLKTLKLSKFLRSSIGKSFLQAFKRLDSIVGKFDEKMELDKSLFIQDEEINLNKVINHFSDLISLKKNVLKIEDLKVLNDITKPINDFLDNVTVNVEDKKLQYNRKVLLLKCTNVLNSFYNFSSLENL